MKPLGKLPKGMSLWVNVPPPSACAVVVKVTAGPLLMAAGALNAPAAQAKPAARAVKGAGEPDFRRSRQAIGNPFTAVTEESSGRHGGTKHGPMLRVWRGEGESYDLYPKNRKQKF